MAEGVGRIKEIGWEDIADMKTGCVFPTIVDDKLPGGSVGRMITYVAPFDRGGVAFCFTSVNYLDF
jgi:hypothetical protein